MNNNVHFFNIDDAIKYGVHSAIVLSNFKFWIDKNMANETNLHEIEIDGELVERTFTFNSIRALKELFPYWSERQVRTAIQNLIDKDVLVKGSYNKIGYDRTSWYALKYETICQKSQMESPKKSNQFDQNDEPIPDNKPYNKHIYNIEIIRLTNYFYGKMMEVNNITKYKNKKIDIDKNYIHIDRLNRIDGYSYEQIQNIIDWLFNNDFWKSNILSARSLRKQVVKLEVQMNKDKDNKQYKVCYEDLM